MPRTYTQLLMHIVFSTKDRATLITPDLRPRLFPHMGGTVRNLDGVALSINGIADHVHLLVSVTPTIALSDFVGKLKANSSKWVHETFKEYWAFAWQLGYSAFSVSCSQKQAVLDYIAGQEEHHRTITFQDELLAFLRRHEIDYDEKYVFE